MGRKLRSVQYRIGSSHEAGQHVRFAIERYVRSVCVEHTTSQCRQIARRIENKLSEAVFEEWRAKVLAENDEKGGGGQ